MPKLITALLLFVVFLPGNSFAQNISTVRGLANACQNVIDAQNGKEYDERSYGLCFGYIRGVKNSYDVRQLSGAKGNICASKNSTWLDYIKIFMDWAERNPKHSATIAWTGVIKSLSGKYPCAHQN